VANDPKVPTVSEVSAQLRALVAQTYALVNDIDDVVDTLHDHSKSMQKADSAFDHQTNDEPESDRG